MKREEGSGVSDRTSLLNETRKLLSEVSELLKAVAKYEANITVMSCLEKNVSALKEAAAVSLPAVERSRYPQLEAEITTRLADMKMLLIKYQKKHFEEAAKVVHNALSAARVQLSSSRWDPGEVLPKLKILESDLDESLKSLFERTTGVSSIMSKQFEAEVAQDLKWIFAEFKYETAKIFGRLKTSLLVRQVHCAKSRTLFQCCPAAWQVFARLSL